MTRAPISEMSQSFSFYRQNYFNCHQWLKQHGFQGLTPISQVISNSNELQRYVEKGRPKNIKIINPPATTKDILNDEIDEDYLKAIQITHQHRKELERKRRQENSHNDWFNYVDISKTESFSIQSEAPNNCDLANLTKNWYQNIVHTKCKQEKIDQYRLVYGPNVDDSDIANVMEMEQELQCSFEQFCDRNQPRFWPVLPIRIKWCNQNE